MTGCKWTTVLRVSAAVYEVLGPALEEIQKDMKNVKNDINTMKSDLASLTQRVDNLTEEVALQTTLESKITSINDSLVDITTELALMNNSVKKDLNFVKTELSRVNEIMGDLVGNVEKHSTQTASALGHLDIRLSYLNESMRDDFNDIKTVLSDISDTVNRTCNTTEEKQTRNTSHPMRMNETVTVNSTNCGGTGGWRRAVYLDMTDPNTNCPSGWQLTGYSKRTCGRANSSRLSCDSVFFPVSEGPYSQVCGRIRAYQHGWPDAFYGYNNAGQTTIDSAYVSGVVVMYGSPRQHIWTFANGARENIPDDSVSNCPCDPDPSGAAMVPPFVGEDYFCESGYVYNSGIPLNTLHSNDTLWDGRDCHSTSTCCSLHYPPYFTKPLNQTTTDDLELRMCFFNPLYQHSYDNIAVELVELYVK